jgi:hypothetical protein
MNFTLPFVGRAKEIASLRRLHADQRHVLIVGAEGIGKSALVAHLRPALRLLVCPASERLSDICEALEQELGLEAGKLHLTERKNRGLARLKEFKRTVVFDGAGWSTPKLASFIERVGASAPVWLCVRSEHPWDVGHNIWPLLARFERLQLKPFHPAETRLLTETAVRHGHVPEITQDIIDWLHRKSAGVPKILCELLSEIANGHYDLNSPHGRRLLDVDRRIHEMFPQAEFQAAKPAP